MRRNIALLRILNIIDVRVNVVFLNKAMFRGGRCRNVPFVVIRSRTVQIATAWKLCKGNSFAVYSEKKVAWMKLEEAAGLQGKFKSICNCKARKGARLC